MGIYRHCLTFIINGKVTSIDDAPGDLTLLSWLRRQKQLTGSKEGCGEGDCGACTVVVTKLGKNGKVQARPANACILFMGMIEGCSLTTIEGLAGPDGQLHPCQQTIVDYHGSQCGFCTPGFVMSLYAAWRNNEGLEDNQIDDTLAGNLCRCTGYRPIVDAGLALNRTDAPHWEKDRLQKEKLLLRSIQHNTCIFLSKGNTTFAAPTDEEEFSEMVRNDFQATIVSGATDVGLWVTKQHRHIRKMIWTGRIEGYDEIKQYDDVVVIRPGVNHQQVMHVLGKRWPAMAQILRRFGSVQVRGTGTLCGNIANASPIGDMPPILIALNAEIELRHGKKTRTLPLEKYFITYGRQDLKKGEFVSAVIIPTIEAKFLRCYKLSKRFDQDISAVMMAANVILQNNIITEARFAFGGMAGIPMRAQNVEKALVGQPLNKVSFAGAAAHLDKDFMPLSDMRGSAEYRLQAARNLVLKYGLELTGAAKIDLANQAGSRMTLEQQC